MSKVDIDKLRKELVDYFGTAMFSGNPQAIIDLEKVRRASTDELISIAQRYGFDISDYIEKEDNDYWR